MQNKAPAVKVIAGKLAALVRMNDHLSLGPLCHTAMVSASGTNSVAIVGFIDQPTSLREYRSITTARYSQPS